MAATETVRTAIDLLAEARTRATLAQQPKVHAKEAILRADLNDRLVGITAADGTSNGLTIAKAVVAAASK